MPRLDHIVTATMALALLFWATGGAVALSAERIRLSAGSPVVRFQGSCPLRVWIEVQLADVRTGQAVPRPALLYLTSDYPAIVFPELPRLDENGFARLLLLIPPPDVTGQRRLQGRFTVWVLIDEEDADGTIEGKLRFTYTMEGDASS